MGDKAKSDDLKAVTHKCSMDVSKDLAAEKRGKQRPGIYLVSVKLECF